MSNTTGHDAGGDNGELEGMGLDDAIASAFDDVGGDAALSSEGNGDAERAAAEQASAATENPQPEPAKPAETPQPDANAWGEADEAALARQAPEVQQLVAKRVAALQAETAPDREMAAGVRKIVDSNGFRKQLEQSGMNEVQGVEYLANLERFARENPADYLRFVANHVKERFGLDPVKELGLASAAPAPTPNGDDAFADPRVSQIEERLNRQEREAAQQRQERILADAGSKIAAFRDAKDGDGKPLRPHFAAVEAQMAALVRADKNMTLEAAYDAAVWSNPTVRAQLQQEERAAAERKSRSEAANAAKAAKANVRPGQRSMTASPSIKSADDAVKAAMDSIGI